jgi:hypothetical protein
MVCHPFHHFRIATIIASPLLGNLWIFENGVKDPGFMGFQASVVDSIPGDPGYTPLWKVSIVEWKTSSGTTPTILGSDDAIAAAESKGQYKAPRNAISNGRNFRMGKVNFTFCRPHNAFYQNIGIQHLTIQLFQLCLV